MLKYNLTIFVMFLFLGSCNKKNTNTNVYNDDKSSLSAIVNEVDVNAKIFNATIDDSTSLGDLNMIAFLSENGLQGEGALIQITLYNGIENGTYEFNELKRNTPMIYGFYYENSENFVKINSGFVTITSHNRDDKYIQGTFNFITEKSIEKDMVWTAKSGNFLVYYQ